MTKLLNDPAQVVGEALAGLVAAHPGLVEVDAEHRVVTRRGGPTEGKVGVVSGGGSGHEPMHAGYVGRGMLDAACCGEVFTSPVPDQFVAACRAADGGAGVLLVLKNYTGDVLNAEMAVELLAEEGGPAVETVVTDDDVAVEDSTWTAGRRGTGVTVLVEKIVGAAAEEGRDLASCAALAREVNARGRSMGVATSACTLPSTGRPSFDLPPGQMELGVGIHGEPGRRRLPLGTAREVAEALVVPVVEDLGLRRGDPVVVLLNGMGGTPLLELHLMFAEVRTLLHQTVGVTVVRSLVGNYITSLEMAGCSVTLLRADDEIVRLWDAPVVTPGLRWGA
ncbi:dihydroxyacetone kinase subunit DhaK [Ornithinimicrobium humiphilum]|uniref:Dihydroxyacetone kinase DhaK subunit n=1 Tax=Ornithinimicrobium humiphilum TaxID=125288 RepID=A0A543KPY7_9MICO|nr:dihydroxyacetone kinase subunit DhaK [Ornithinimicrobium humiphilum]TQM97145.1 dihydroxyacetone kinase DhaK subunit [Ornithinimicrobium humiphilum]